MLPDARFRSLRSKLDTRALQLPEETAALDLDPGFSVVLVPVGAGRARAAMLRLLRDADAIAGPARPWAQVRSSYLRVIQTHRLGLHGDTDDHLAALVVGADVEARDDLRTRVLAPLQDQSPASRAKLTETLRAWLLHQGRRDDVADAIANGLGVHEQRVGQLRDLYGDKLTDPEFVRDVVIALG
jgi:hypothetical protein